MSNENVIKDAFNSLCISKHKRIIQGLRNALRDGVLYALEQHRLNNLPNHLHDGDSYGWAIGHDGKIVDMVINTGDYLVDDNRVSEQLDELIAGTSGYIGVIMAGMSPDGRYKAVHEINILNATKDMIAAEFNRFFKEV